MVTMDPQNKSEKERVAATTEPTSGLFLKEGARKGKGLSQRNGGGWRVRRRLCPDGTACRARSLLRQKKQIRVHATIEQRRLCRALPGEAEDCIRHPSALLSRPLHLQRAHIRAATVLLVPNPVERQYPSSWSPLVRSRYHLGRRNPRYKQPHASAYPLPRWAGALLRAGSEGCLCLSNGVPALAYVVRGNGTVQNSGQTSPMPPSSKLWNTAFL
ncbi:hypothetical protein LZ32DRAFT_337856 [Colletotrichum eremochloae]|nr:hypothetical protein LZ32DRAFT_337856 [Colletotrichum eremochloae]